MSEWISVKDRLPQDRTGQVLYEVAGGDIGESIKSIAFFDHNNDFWSDPSFVLDSNEVTHWRECNIKETMSSYVPAPEGGVNANMLFVPIPEDLFKLHKEIPSFPRLKRSANEEE